MKARLLPSLDDMSCKAQKARHGMFQDIAVFVDDIAITIPVVVVGGCTGSENMNR